MAKIKQHYVPQFYLKNFALLKNGQYFVNCFDKVTLSTFKVNVKDVACEKLFYEVPDAPANSFENALSDFERQIPQVYNKMVSSSSISCLKWREKGIIAQFVALQMLRTREMREYILDIAKGIKECIGDRPTTEQLSKEIKEATTETSAQRHQLVHIAETLLGKNRIVDMLLDLKWIMLENQTKIPFWTSDNPITRYNPNDYSPYGNLGILCWGIQIFMPLNPKLGLMFCDPIEYYFMCDKEYCEKENLVFYNTLQLQSNTRHIFSINSDFGIAKKWLSEYRTGGEIDRKRALVTTGDKIKVPKDFNSDDYRYFPDFRYLFLEKYRNNRMRGSESSKK